MTNILSPKSQKIFSCEDCGYNTSNKKDFKKHLLTLKHLNTIKYKENGIKIPINRIFTCECGKAYPYQASLYNHKKKCDFKDSNKIINTENQITYEQDNRVDYKDMFLTMIK